MAHFKDAVSEVQHRLIKHIYRLESGINKVKGNKN